MTFSMTDPIPGEGMVCVFFWKCFALGEKRNNFLQKLNLLTALLCQLVVFFEYCGVFYRVLHALRSAKSRGISV